MERKRKRFGSEEKVRVLRRHLVDKVPVSELCEEHVALKKSLGEL